MTYIQILTELWLTCDTIYTGPGFSVHQGYDIDKISHVIIVIV